MLAITVTLGRNYGESAGDAHNAPMSDAEWSDFQTEVSAAIHARVLDGADVWEERHYAVSDAWNGVPEESVKVTVLGAERFQVQGLAETLKPIGKRYHQDAVALTYGHSVLV